MKIVYDSVIFTWNVDFLGRCLFENEQPYFATTNSLTLRETCRKSDPYILRRRSIFKHS